MKSEKKHVNKWLIVLIIVGIIPILLLLAEVVCMGIKFLAPNSDVALFIDSVINWIVR